MVVDPSRSGQHHFGADIEVVGWRRVQHHRQTELAGLQATVLHHW